MKITLELYLRLNRKRIFVGEIDLEADLKNAAAIGLERSAQLTSRETEVRDLMVAGKVHKEIAVILNLSESGVKQHAGNLYRKYGVRSRGALVYKLLQHPDKAGS